MSNKSQELNMRRLAALLSQDLSYIGGERECGPNGAKRTFLNVGKTFLRALAKDLCLHDVTVRSNAGGIAVSGWAGPVPYHPERPRPQGRAQPVSEFERFEKVLLQ